MIPTRRRPDLEQAYRQALTRVDPHDGKTSLREAVQRGLSPGASPADHAWVEKAQAEVDSIRKQLLDAGYTYEQLLALATEPR